LRRALIGHRLRGTAELLGTAARDRSPGGRAVERAEGRDGRGDLPGEHLVAQPDRHDRAAGEVRRPVRGRPARVPGGARARPGPRGDVHRQPAAARGPRPWGGAPGNDGTLGPSRWPRVLGIVIWSGW